MAPPVGQRSATHQQALLKKRSSIVSSIRTCPCHPAPHRCGDQEACQEWLDVCLGSVNCQVLKMSGKSACMELSSPLAVCWISKKQIKVHCSDAAGKPDSLCVLLRFDLEFCLESVWFRQARRHLNQQAAYWRDLPGFVHRDLHVVLPSVRWNNVLRTSEAALPFATTKCGGTHCVSYFLSLAFGCICEPSPRFFLSLWPGTALLSLLPFDATGNSCHVGGRCYLCSQ